MAVVCAASFSESPPSNGAPASTLQPPRPVDQGQTRLLKHGQILLTQRAAPSPIRRRGLPTDRPCTGRAPPVDWPTPTNRPASEIHSHRSRSMNAECFSSALKSAPQLRRAAVARDRVRPPDCAEREIRTQRATHSRRRACGARLDHARINRDSRARPARRRRASAYASRRRRQRPKMNEVSGVKATNHLDDPHATLL